MTDYFTALGMKARGSASGIRGKRETLYGSPYSIEAFEWDSPDDVAADDAGFAGSDAVSDRGTAATLVRTAASRNGRDSLVAEEMPPRNDRARPAMAMQVPEPRHSLENDADELSVRTGASALQSAEPSRAPSSVDTLQRSPAPDSGDPVAFGTFRLDAKRDRVEQLQSEGIDQGIRRFSTEPGALARPAYEAATGFIDNASADAVQRSVVIEAEAVRHVAGISRRGASIATERPNPASSLAMGATIVASGSDRAGAPASAGIDARSDAAREPGHPTEKLPRHSAPESRASTAVRPRPKTPIRRDETTGDDLHDAVSAPAAAEEKSLLSVISARVASSQSVPDLAGRSAPAGLAVQDVQPAVQVSIGRIEIREQRPPAPPPAARRVQSPRMDLKDYLNRRLRGGAS